MTTHPTPTVEEITVQRVTFARGDGQNTVYRNVVAYYVDGQLIAEADPCERTYEGTLDADRPHFNLDDGSTVTWTIGTRLKISAMDDLAARIKQ